MFQEATISSRRSKHKIRYTGAFSMLKKPKLFFNNLRLVLAMKIFNPVLRKLGYTLIADHFYQPIANERDICLYQNKQRPLPALSFDLDRQSAQAHTLLENYSAEFNNDDILCAFGYSRNSSTFGRGDAEFLYSLIREKKPGRIVEIGGGSSSQIILAALKQNFVQNQKPTNLTIVEPFPGKDYAELDLSFLEFTLLEKPVQSVEIDLFQQLQANDLLFVDSSHVFKHGSDVEFEFMQIYPTLNSGVFVHIHDIFIPFDYPVEWNKKRYFFWNEQYFLESFLSFNSRYEVFAALAMLFHYHNEIFQQTMKAFLPEMRPGSFWMKVI